MSIFISRSIDKLKGVKKQVDDPHRFAAMIKYLAAGIPLRYVEEFFSSAPKKSLSMRYEPVTDTFCRPPVDFMRAVIKPILSNVTQWRSEGHNLLLYGPNGSGKTHSALYLMAQYISRDQEAYYSTFKEFYFLHNAVAKDMTTEEGDFYRAILNVDLLVLDELGKETHSEAVVAFLETIMKDRFYNKKQTILITNLDVARESDGTVKEFLKRYGNSCWDLVRQGYHIYLFSKKNDFRASERIEWQ